MKTLGLEVLLFLFLWKGLNYGFHLFGRRERRRGRGRRREREPQADTALRTEPDVGCHLMTLRS